MKIKPFKTIETLLHRRLMWMPSAILMVLSESLKGLHARWNGMSRARAETLVESLVHMHFKGLVFDDYKEAQLPMDVSLSEFIRARDIVNELPYSLDSNGNWSMKMSMADRGIGAIYAISHFGPQGFVDTFMGLLTDEVWKEEGLPEVD